jgi:hypothetical protein
MEKAIASLSIPVLVALQLMGQQWQSITNERENYKIMVPRNWITWPIDETGVLYVTTFGRNQTLGGGVVPAGQAAISIFSQKGSAIELDAWIAERSKNMDDVQRLQKTIPNLEAHADVKSYVQISARDELGPGSHYRLIIDYFTLNGRIFAAELEFKEHDTREKAYRMALDRAVETFTVIPK